ncbi:hypothetical protein HJG60_009354 [Phyllostomus discolor]|uniref:Uncharacterized protein n=1 Tax=Phyllostomus discolor TaxID=89673 RepID=A0A834DCF4_9CHIR|nr:hypothetical protein HJG60_009354 [Phyllostomus discolor]
MEISPISNVDIGGRTFVRLQGLCTCSLLLVTLFPRMFASATASLLLDLGSRGPFLLRIFLTMVIRNINYPLPHTYPNTLCPTSCFFFLQNLSPPNITHNDIYLWRALGLKAQTVLLRFRSMTPPLPSW